MFSRRVLVIENKTDEDLVVFVFEEEQEFVKEVTMKVRRGTMEMEQVRVSGGEPHKRAIQANCSTHLHFNLSDQNCYLSVLTPTKSYHGVEKAFHGRMGFILLLLDVVLPPGLRSFAVKPDDLSREVGFIEKDEFKKFQEGYYPGARAFFWREPTPLMVSSRAQTFCGDHANGPDLLDIKPQVHAMADALALNDLEPPFALGVLGDWGSGKSFAMKLIKDRLGEIMDVNLESPQFSESNRKNFPYVGHIYTVEFSAWTYSKRNLWASLMYRILNDLNDQLSLEALLREADLVMHGFNLLEAIEKTTTGQRKALEAYLEKKDIQDEIKEQLEGWHKKDGEASDVLIQALQQGYETDIKSLPHKQLELEKVNKAIKRNKMRNIFCQKVEETFEEELKEFRKKNPSDDNIDDMLEAIGWIRSSKKLFWSGLQELTTTEMIIVFVLVAVSVVLPILFDRYMALVSSIIPTFSTAVLSIQRARSRLRELGVKDAISFVNAGHLNNIEEGQGPSGKDQRKKKQLENEIKSIQKRIWLFEGDSLLEAVQDRLKASKYEAELGVVHQAQKDLLQLSEAMLASPKQQDVPVSPGYVVTFYSKVVNFFTQCFGITYRLKKRKINRREQKTSCIFPRGKPRIVLFVDDLDRCPPQQVVEMLEALQLLVKTKLFVAVVALDVRYVTRALEKTYKDILHPDLRPSAIEYVQKILQISYNMPSIKPTSLRNYLESQMNLFSQMDGINQAVEDDSRVAGPVEETGTDEENQSEEENKSQDSHVSDPKDKVQAHDVRSSAKDSYVVSSDAINFAVEDLDIVERACKLAKLNPRAARRLVNVYKLLKIVWDRSPAKDPGVEVKTSVITLLAVTSSYPLIMSPLLTALEGEVLKLEETETQSERVLLRRSESNETLADFIKEFLKESKLERWSTQAVEEWSGVA